MAGFAYYVTQRNDTINDSIFHMLNGMQGAFFFIAYLDKAEANIVLPDVFVGRAEEGRGRNALQLAVLG